MSGSQNIYLRKSEHILFIHSPWFFSRRNYTNDLGGVIRNSSGHVVRAEVAWVQIVLQLPEEAELVDPGGIGLEFEVCHILQQYNVRVKK